MPAPFDWKEYLDLADELTKAAVALPCNDACLRSAGSRAYYAAFHKARDYALAHGFIPPQRAGNEHAELPRYLLRQGRLNLSRAAKDLDRLRENRRKFDYEAQIANVPSLAKASVLMAQSVYQRIP